MRAGASLFHLLGLRSWRSGRARAVVAVGASAAVACQLIAGIDDRKVAGDGGSEAAGGDGGPANPCGEIGFPPAPDSSTSSPSDPIDVTLALYSVDTGTAGGKLVRGVGLNLDRTCTCPGPSSCQGTMPFCDDAGGADNEGQQVFAQLQNVAAAFDAGQFFNDDLFNNALKAGNSGVLVRVRGYNGKADDAEVQVAIYSSLGSMGMPQWMGNDSWRIDQSYTMGNSVDAPVYEVTGWVRNFTLVASPRLIPILIGSSIAQPVKVTLESGHILGALDVQGGVVRGLKGTLAGRWKARDFLTNLQGVPDPVQSGQYLCGSSLTYTVIKSSVCQHRDIAGNPDNDGKNTTCDAVSMAIGFDARPAKLGPTAPAPAPLAPCDAGWVGTCN